MLALYSFGFIFNSSKRGWPRQTQKEVIMNAARQFIESIASNMTEVKKPLKAIRDTLEDGEALAYFGATDDDQSMVEEAHDMVTQWLDTGLTTLDQVA